MPLLGTLVKFSAILICWVSGGDAVQQSLCKDISEEGYLVESKEERKPINKIIIINS